jgi:L-asparaginase/beta-aspartyl-peptidase (threonine type)
MSPDHRRPVALVVHGGAGAKQGRDYSRQVAHMRGLVERFGPHLQAGEPALDIVQALIVELEASGLYVAGRGASPNTGGRYELDASLMNGHDRRAAAVAALQGFRSPITAARRVMERTPHVMLAGDGACEFATREGLEGVGDAEAYYTHAEWDAATAGGGLSHGTVGCVALDAGGRLAAGTSTAGVFNKLPGRVGDTPLIGAGCWADDHAAVSCTGMGEQFIRSAVAYQVAARIRFAGDSLMASAQAALDEVKALGGDGGLIALDASGAIAMPYNSEGMKRAALYPDGRIVAEAF